MKKKPMPKKKGGGGRPCLALTILALIAFNVALALATPVKAHAAPSTPWLDSQRFTAAVGIDRELLISYPLLKERWSGVGALAYNILSPSADNPNAPRLSLTFRYGQPFDGDMRPTGNLGIRYTLPIGGGKFQQ